LSENYLAKIIVGTVLDYKVAAAAQLTGVSALADH